jgi:hypothetical protein
MRRAAKWRQSSSQRGNLSFTSLRRTISQVRNDSYSIEICSTLGGNRVNPPSVWENANSGSGMVTPAGTIFVAKVFNPAKRAFLFIFALGKRIATLEGRVRALETALGTQPADACPFCGERAMRKTQSGALMGDQGRQWWSDVWTCKSCGKSESRRQKL